MINLEQLQSPIFDIKSGGRDIGEKGVKNGIFRHFLKNGTYDLVHFLSEERYYIITCLCKISSTGKFLFSRYGAKGGQKWGFSARSQKVMNRFGSFS